jgi:HAD superfamily hydrolase (TIGR01549 family)
MESKIFYFDLDDTLVNTRETIFKRIGVLLNRFSLKEDPQLIYDILDNENREILLRKKIEESSIFWQEYEKLRIEFVVQSMKGTKKVLESLILMGAEIGIITNNSHSKALNKLRYAGLDTFPFNAGIYGRDNLGYFKPSPEIFKIMGIDPKISTYVGDDLMDYRFARNNGCAFIAVCSGGYKKEDFVRAGLNRDLIFEKIGDINY